MDNIDKVCRDFKNLEIHRNETKISLLGVFLLGEPCNFCVRLYFSSQYLILTLTSKHALADDEEAFYFSHTWASALDTFVCQLLS